MSARAPLADGSSTTLMAGATAEDEDELLPWCASKACAAVQNAGSGAVALVLTVFDDADVVAGAVAGWAAVTVVSPRDERSAQ